MDSFVNADGPPTRRIPLPPIGALPAKGQLLSCETAREKAKALGIPAEFALLDFEFVPKYRSFVWKVSDTRKVEPSDLRLFEGSGTYRVMLIDAHTGQVLDDVLETIVI